MAILEYIRGILFQKLFLLRGNQISVVTNGSYQKPRSAWAPWPPLPHHHQLEENEKTWGIRTKAEFLTSNLSNKKKSFFQPESDLWLLAEGRSSTMMTSRMVEKSRRQKASSTHRSLQPCGGKPDLLNKTALVKQHSQKERKHTDRLTVHQLEDFGGPDDEDDGGWGHSWTTTNAN